MSQSELARRIGVTQATIWKLLNEPVQGSKYLHRIADEMSTSAAYLMDETDDSDLGYQPREHLTSEERELLELLGRLEAKDRAAVFQIVRTMAKAGIRPTLHTPQQEFKGA